MNRAPPAPGDAVRTVTARAQRFDAVIIGGGHNGLVCAAYLAARGPVGLRARAARASSAARRSPRNSIRASATRPRATRSACSIRRSSAISSSPSTGSRSSSGRSPNFLPLPGRRLSQGRRRARGDAGGGRASFSRRDADALPAYYAMLDRVADVLRDLLLATPPNVGGGMRARCSTRGRSRSASARSTSPASATCSTSSRRARATCSTAGSSRRRSRRRSASTPSSATSRARTRRARPTCCCITCSARSTASAAQWGHALGGMGAITQAMAAECAARGVDAAHRRAGRARDRRRRHARRASSSRAARSSRRGASSPTSIRSCCSSGSSRPSICPPISARASPAIAAARARSG